MRKISKSRLLRGTTAIGLATIALSAGSAAHAQTTTDQATASSPIERASTTEEIVVTATKRATRVQDVPVSIVVISPAQITETGLVSTAQLPRLAPGLAFAQAGEAKLNSFFLRGVGTYALSSALEASVGVAVDGVPLARVGGSITDLVDLERVEVLRGPQGMLFGKNATAGLISMVTKKPVFGATSAEGRVSYGSFNEFNVDANVNLALGDRGAFRIAAWRFSHDGIVTGAVDGKKYGDKNTYGVRVSASVEPTSNLRFTLIGQFDGRDENGSALTHRVFTGTPGAGALIEAYERSIGIVPSPTNRVADFFAQPYSKASNLAITALADWDVGGGYNVSSVTSYRDVTNEGRLDAFTTSSPLLHLNNLEDREKYHQFTHELRLASPVENRLSFVAGLFFYDFAIRDVQNQSISGIITPGVSRYTRRNTLTNSLTNVSAFGEATFRVVPGIRLVAGARQSHDRSKGSFDRARVGADILPVPPTAALLNFVSAPITYDFTSYRFGFQADLAPDVMLYATTARGYKAPGFNLSQSLQASQLITNGVPNNALVNAETVRSYEGGLKSQFFNRRLTINATVFFSTFENFQTTVTPPVTPPQFLIQNAKELKSSGVEFEVSARPIRDLSLALNGAYIDARYTDYTNAPCYNRQPTLPAGSPLTRGFCVAGVQSLNGVQLAQSPKWSINATARYEAKIGEDWHGFVGGDYSYRSRTLFEGTADPNEQQGGYDLVNLLAGFGPSDGRWTVSAYARNIFSTNFVNRVRNFSGVYQQYPVLEAQRRFGVMLEVKL